MRDRVPRPPAGDDADGPTRPQLLVVVLLQLIMATELVLLLIEGQYLTSLLVVSVMAMTLVPFAFQERMPVHVPPAFQVLAILFVFASLYLGEVRSFYIRFWWWDLALHLSSGLLLGVVGFLLVYVLNENGRIDFYLQPAFMALFAFLFAVAMGTFWEIFEYGVDGFFGMSMQKQHPGEVSGLSDTMQDLIVDTLGASVVAFFGWWYMKRRERFIILNWIRRFIRRNPRLFRK